MDEIEDHKKDYQENDYFALYDSYIESERYLEKHSKVFMCLLLMACDNHHQKNISMGEGYTSFNELIKDGNIGYPCLKKYLDHLVDEEELIYIYLDNKKGIYYKLLNYRKYIHIIDDENN